MCVTALSLPALAAAQPSDDQRFKLIFTADPSQEPGKVVAQGGPITGPGAVHVTSGSSTGLTATYEFNDGSIFVEVTFLGGSFDPDFQSCTARSSSSAEIEITGGTGAYAGASGTGVATGTARLVGQRGPRGECLLGQQPPKRGLEIVDVSTTLELGG